MIYSVFRADRKVYDYYEDSRTDARAPVATHVRKVSPLGATAEAASWRLPLGARKIGSGPTPRGMVAVDGVATALAGDSPIGGISWSWLAAGAAAFLLWKRR